MPEQTTEQLLAERGTTHGEYFEHARCTQAIVEAVQRERNWPRLPPVIRETVHMLAHKLGRVATGNPFLRDHWDDSAGYSKLVSQRINDDQTGMKPWPPEPTDAAKLESLFVSAGATVLRPEPTEAGERAMLQGATMKGAAHLPELPDPRDPDGEVRHTKGVGVDWEGSLGTEPLTRERLAAALKHAFNCCGYDAKLSEPDYALAKAAAELIRTPDVGVPHEVALWSVGRLREKIGSAVYVVGVCRRSGRRKYEVADELMPYVLDHLRGTTSVQTIARVEEHGGERSAYSALYDAMAYDFNLPRDEIKRRFSRAIFHPAGVLGGEGGADLHPDKREPYGLLARNDDGSEVYFSSYSVGASPYGAWGQISLRFSTPSNPAGDKIRVYREERSVLDVVFDALGLKPDERALVSENIETPYRGKSYNDVSRELAATVTAKGYGRYRGRSAQFAAHVFVLARLLATAADRGGATLGGGELGSHSPRKGGELSEQG